MFPTGCISPYPPSVPPPFLISKPISWNVVIPFEEDGVTNGLSYPGGRDFSGRDCWRTKIGPRRGLFLENTKFSKGRDYYVVKSSNLRKSRPRALVCELAGRSRASPWDPSASMGPSERAVPAAPYPVAVWKTWQGRDRMQ
ncbi:Hypp1118 [Branchiostoma lanceolatum]|uniref:Hypp1118 protein n=1 Tax=Branchiostoma lanceolatum TaxID=7740 RepID=A0A8J9ZGW3_BRALA|nr:Hypp1118 [Branchiostoma lanceolatum]